MASFIAIDPGAAGAVAFWTDGRLGLVLDMPAVTDAKGKRRVDAAGFAEMIDGTLTHAVVEKVGAMPGNGSSSMFSFGKAVGLVLGALAARGIPVTEITPAQWKGALRVPASKDAARSRASQLMPYAAKHWPLKKHDGRAEAALLALYWHTRGRVDGSAIEW